jgi:hypothetical protein
MTTLSITPLSITTFIRMGLFVILNLNYTQQNSTQQRGLICDAQHTTTTSLSITILNLTTLSIMGLFAKQYEQHFV